jgi:hypothetical protein
MRFVVSGLSNMGARKPFSHNVSANHAVVFAAMKARRSALVNDKFLAREGAIPSSG